MTTLHQVTHNPIRPIGPLDGEKAAEALELLTVLRRGPCVVLDLSLITFIDAGGLGAIVSLRNELITTGRELCLVNVQPRHARIFRLAGLGALL